MIRYAHTLPCYVHLRITPPPPLMRLHEYSSGTSQLETGAPARYLAHVRRRADYNGREATDAADEMKFSRLGSRRSRKGRRRRSRISPATTQFALGRVRVGTEIERAVASALGMSLTGLIGAMAASPAFQASEPAAMSRACRSRPRSRPGRFLHGVAVGVLPGCRQSRTLRGDRRRGEWLAAGRSVSHRVAFSTLFWIAATVLCSRDSPPGRLRRDRRYVFAVSLSTRVPIAASCRFGFQLRDFGERISVGPGLATRRVFDVTGRGRAWYMSRWARPWDSGYDPARPLPKLYRPFAWFQMMPA